MYPTRPTLLPAGWVVIALFALNPIFWVLGVGGFIWSIAALPLLVWVLIRPRLVMPPTTWWMVVYLAWVVVTIVQVDRMTRVLGFGLRFTATLTALLLAVYVYNERRVSREAFVRWVAMFWVWAIIGGYVGLLFPNQRLSVTPASIVLPGSLSGDEYIDNLVRPRFAQVQNLFGVEIPRPATLFSFTNEWGGAVGLLTPFFIAATIYSPDRRTRQLGVIGLVLAVPPMVVSVNRGLWLSVGAILAVVAVQSFVAGHTAPLRFLGAGIVALAGLLVVTPIGGLIGGRLSESDANTRAGIYREAWQGALDSPVFGWGTPRPSTNPFSPAVGTHGHVWYAMFAHGLVGLALYVGWIVWAMYSVRAQRDPVSIMMSSVVVVGAVQMFFYTMLPVSLSIIMVAIGLYFRAETTGRRAVVPSSSLRTVDQGARS